MKNDDSVLGWITRELRDDAIPHVKPDVLDSALERLEFVAVVYYDQADEAAQASVVVGMQEVADECRMHDIVFVVATAPRLIEALGEVGFKYEYAELNPSDRWVT